MVQKKASDLYITAGARISLKIDGRLLPTSLPELSPEAARELAYELMSPEQIQRFEETREMNFGYGISGVGRFRINVFRQRGAVALVARHLPSNIPAIVDLGLPPVLERLALERRGLVLVVGAAGSGKTSTMAAMIEHRNQRMDGHILTVEDPVEYVFSHKKSLVNQREVGTDTDSYDLALMNALRESPDMIMIGEIRERNTMEQVIGFANTGHFCLSTLHAINSYQALTRIISFFPLETRNAVLFDLASCLVGIVAQRLVRTKSGVRVPAVEVFVVNYHMRELIREGKLGEIREIIEKGRTDELQSFDYALIQLYRQGRIDFDEAKANSDSPRQLHLLADSTEEDIPGTSAVAASSGARLGVDLEVPSIDLP